MEPMDTVRDTASKILAPVMVEYVKWILSEAERLGIRRIYFLARDGWMMYRAGCILAENRHPRIECRYLECSRYALRLPSFALLGKESLDQIFLDGIDVTLGKILARAGLDRQEALGAAQAAGVSVPLDKILTRQEIRRLKPLFFHCPPFWQMVESHAQKALPGVYGYLRQEGLFDDIRWAVADSGWTGSLQQTLKVLLEKEGFHREINGFYFGLYQLPKGVQENLYHAYYFPVRGKIRRKAYFSNSLFECVFGAPRGMTEGYQRTKQGCFVPRYRPAPGENFPALHVVEDAVVFLARQRAARLPLSIRAWELCPAGKLERLLAPFMGTPTPRQAHAFGCLTFTDDVLEEPGRELAPVPSGDPFPLPGGHLLTKVLAAAQLAARPPGESAWMEGSVVRRGKHVRRQLAEIRLYKYALYLKKSVLRIITGKKRESS